MSRYWDLFWATGMPEAWTLSRRAGEKPEMGAALAPFAAPGIEMQMPPMPVPEELVPGDGAPLR